MAIFTFVFIYAGLAHAGDYTAELLRARSSAEISRATARFERLRVARSACKLQLRGERVPSACYESLRLENEGGMHPRAADRARLLAKLDDLCEHASAALKITTDEDETSPNCRRYVRSARQIQNYRENGPDWSGN